MPNFCHLALMIWEEEVRDGRMGKGCHAISLTSLALVERDYGEILQKK